MILDDRERLTFIQYCRQRVESATQQIPRVTPNGYTW